MAPLPSLSPFSATLAHISATLLRRDDPTIKLAAAEMLTRRSNTIYAPGIGAKAPDTMNNKGFFALFGLIGAAMVVATIWFFFWAKNGGFVWHQGDWDDYKSTVLRRKDKDGNTLSNATKSTKLGQKSIAGTFTDYDGDEKLAPNDYGYPAERKKGRKARPHARTREPSDEDVKAYRHEKAARVGGMNREADGSHFDYSNTERSDVASDIFSSDISQRPLNQKPVAAPKKKSYMEKKRERKEEKKQMKEQQKSKRQVREELLPHRNRLPSYTTADASTIADDLEYTRGSIHDNEESYYAAYRPEAPIRPYATRHDSPRRQSPAARHVSPHRHSPRNPTYEAPRRNNAPPANRSRQSSPRKDALPKYPGAFDAYSDAGTSDTGTRVYRHHIPELSRGNNRDAGYRRDAMGGRRDSLSDSDGDGDLGHRRY